MLKRFTTHSLMALAEASLIALLVVGLIAGTAFAGKGGKGGGKPTGGAHSGTIWLAPLVVDNNGNGLPNRGDVVTFGLFAIHPVCPARLLPGRHPRPDGPEGLLRRLARHELELRSHLRAWESGQSDCTSSLAYAPAGPGPSTHRRASTSTGSGHWFIRAETKKARSRGLFCSDPVGQSVMVMSVDSHRSSGSVVGVVVLDEPEVIAIVDASTRKSVFVVSYVVPLASPAVVSKVYCWVGTAVAPRGRRRAVPSVPKSPGRGSPSARRRAPHRSM